MAVSIAGVSNTGKNENPDVVQELNQENNEKTTDASVAVHGDESHASEEVTTTEPEVNPVMQKASAVTFSSSPAKIGNVGYNNPTFRMKASGAKYNNSPIEKNFGSPIHRGFATFGVGSKETQGGVGARLEPPLKSSSPAKGFFSNLKDRVLNLTKKASKVPTTVSTPTTDDANATIQAENSAKAQVTNTNAQIPPHSHGTGGNVDASNQAPVGKVQVADASGFGKGGPMGEMTAQTGVDFSNEKVKQEPNAWGGIGEANANLLT